MKFSSSLLAASAFLAVLSCAVGVSAQGKYALTFTGQGSYKDIPAAPWSGDYFAVLTQSDCVVLISDTDPPTDPPDGLDHVDDEGAQGWSISVVADNATINSITTAGTDAGATEPPALGFNKTQLSNPAKTGNKECAAAANKGAVSAVVLRLTEALTLGCNSTKSVAKINIGGTIPAVDGTATLRFANGCQGAGQPVDNNITERGDTVLPTTNPFPIALQVKVAPPSCCARKSLVGFSGEKIRSDLVYSGIEEVEPDPAEPVCAAAGGTIEVMAPKGEVAAMHVFANISSNDLNNPPPPPPAEGEEPLPPIGVQGWSFSIAVNGADVELATATTAGTSVDIFGKSPFNKTQIIDPAKNLGQRGAVSAIVLALTEAAILPPTGTDSVFDIGLKSAAPLGDLPVTGEVKFQTGLRGSGQPVGNALTIDGNTVDACNFGTAQVNVLFTPILGPPPQHAFIRGNANDDSKIDIADAVWIINAGFRGGPATLCEDAADVNDSGTVTDPAADAVFLIDYLFRAGSPPMPPFPACGADPTDDTLACDGSLSLNSCP